MTICKSFIRPHLDYGDVVYDRASNESLSQSLESLHIDAAIAIFRAIRGTSSEKRFQELSLETRKIKTLTEKIMSVL